MPCAGIRACPGQPYNPFAPGNSQQDPRKRRALREQAVAYAGSNSRPFVEKYSDDAVAAVLACTQAVEKAGRILCVGGIGQSSQAGRTA